MAKAEFRLEGEVGEIVIADPPLNLFGLELARELGSATADARDSGARAILVRAEGDNFSAGANVEMFLGRDEAAARELLEGFMSVSSVGYWGSSVDPALRELAYLTASAENDCHY